MITYLTRLSYLNTATDLHDDLLVQLSKEASELALALLLSELDEELASHPTVRMWSGSEAALCAYAVSLETIATTRGFQMGRDLIIAQELRRLRAHEELPYSRPVWHEDTDVIRSHRSNLARRYPEIYGDMWKGTPQDLPYLWPFPDDEGGYGLFISKADKELLFTAERELPRDIASRVENL